MDDDLDIAIVGLACRFPSAKNPEEFWRNLAAGVESISRLSDEEILRSGAPKSHLSSPNYVKAAPVLDDPGAFDAAFFGFTPGEARTMDPQHRLLLELAHEAFEDAGCVPSDVPARVGVFAGSAMNTYFMHAGLNRNFAEDYIPTLIFNDKDFLSTRISYKLNLKGPSLTVQTACSTSLVAVHLARQSLLSEECDIALAGAVSVRVPHRAGYFSDPGGVSSPDGHVRAFDADANGTVFGSGGGVIVLKRLRDAIADGDNIRAIIKGSAINNDGAEKAGYTAPSVNSQADAIIEALANADVSAESISYIETHGSGTPVGDPIEVRALTKAFHTSTRRTGFCAIGSVKTNVGHLDAAAGMAGLIKTVLALQNRQIPPSLNYSRPNPEIDFPATPFFVNTQLSPWVSASGPRRAGIMSTGMGGTNAHVVLEEAPAIASTSESKRPNLFILSARTESSLTASAENLRAFLEANPTVNLDDAAFTFQTGRRAMPHRRFVVAKDRAEAIASLSEKPQRMSVAHADRSVDRPLVLLLPGVGDHYVGMGRELYAAIPTFRAEVDRCAEILRAQLGCDIREILWPKNRDWQQQPAARGIDLKKMLAGNTQPPDDEDTLRLNKPAHLQPALFTIEYALARLWMDLGITPQAIVGHSMGEYVAACVSGVFSLEDALHLIVRRTQLVASLPPARMLAVTLPESELQPLLTGELSIALINGPSLCIVAGPPAAVVDFERALATRGVTFRPVQNTHSFHSRLLDPIVGEFESEVRKIRLNPPQIPFVSNVTGNWISKAEATDPAYWARHLNHTARFNDALRTLWQMENALLLEAGPGKTLGVLAMQHPARQKAGNPVPVASLRHHYENESDLELLLNAAGRLWISGADLRWEKFHAGRAARKVSLPTYPFERQNFWIGNESTQAASRSKSAGPSSLGIDDWFYVPSWERTLFPRNLQNQSEPDGILWLVVTDRPEHATSFRKLITSRGTEVQSVIFGGKFARSPDGVFEINPPSRDDCLKLFREIKSRDWSAIHIIHLGCLAEAPDLDSGFFSLMSIAQAIGAQDISVPVKIGIISSGLHEVTGGETLHPQMAAVLGPCSVIPKEFPNVICFNVDLPDSENRRALGDGIAEKVAAEFAGAVCGEIVAFRGTHRWRRKFDRVQLSAAESCSAGSPATRLRERGVYLITGGTGGIGLALAEHLAQTYRATLVLTKKSAFPEKSRWAELAVAKDTPVALRKILGQLLELESIGATVEVIAADVSDREQMQRVFTETLHRHGAIHGVIHAAGVIHDGLIEGKTREIAEAVLFPKLRGCEVLHALSKSAGSDFLVLFSSTASVLGPRGQIDYSAANACLDAFSQSVSGTGGPRTLTINWPGWREVGILAEMETAPGMQQWKEEALAKAISTNDGLEAFHRALESDLPQVIVSPQDLHALLDESRTLPPGGPGSSGNETRGEDIAMLTEQEPEDVIAGIWRGVLGITDIGHDESFFDLGGHSLLAMQAVGRLRARYHVDITLRDFFEAPTIARLGICIREKLVQDIASLSDEEVRALLARETQPHE